MSELRSAVEALRAEALADLPDARVEDDFAELQRVGELLEMERLRRLAEIDRRRLFQREGHLSSASWLSARFGVGWGEAQRHTRVARALADMPAARRALEAGDVSMSAVRVLASAHDVDPTAFARSEEQLVDAARRHSVAGLARVVSFWRECVERERAAGADAGRRATRQLHASVTLGGMVRVDGDLDPEAGEALLSALAAVMDAEARGGGADQRTPAQRRADALHEICRQWLDLSDRPRVAGERPHLTVTVDAEALADPSGGTAELDRVGAIDGRVARRLACDASVVRVVMRAGSQPLDVAGARRSCHQGCDARSSCATGTAASPAATGTTRGATRTTSCTGPTVA